MHFPTFFIPLSPSNLRPFGAPPSIGRRECPREPLPLEGAAERSEAGLASFFAAKPPPLCLPHAGKALSIDIVFPTYPIFALTIGGIAAFSFRSLPHWGRGTASAVDRVLSYIVDLRRISSLFFTPPEPYPARSARHLPHAGKALSVGILFLHVSCIRSDNARKAASPYRSLPPWGRGTAPAVDRVLSYIVDLRRISHFARRKV